MAEEIKPDTNIPDTSKGFQEMQRNSREEDFRSRLLQIRDEVPTRYPNNFFDSFQIVKTGNGFANLYSYVDNEWKLIGASLIDLESGTTTVQNTTDETNLTKFTLKKNTLNSDGELKIEIPIQELDLLNSTSNDEITFKLYLDSTVVDSQTAANPTSSSITDDTGFITCKIINGGAKDSQRNVVNVLTKNYSLDSFSTSSVDTTVDRTVKVTATFEGADTSNKLVTGNATAKIIP